MSSLVQPRFVNDPFSDPALFVDFRFGRRAILFDLGDVAPLTSRELGRVTHAFVSHRHMDHFAGFDRLLHARLYRPGRLCLAGPDGFIRGVTAKIDAYTWNLLDESSPNFEILASEFVEGQIRKSVLFRSQEKFAPRPHDAPEGLPAGLLLQDPEFRIECVALDHGTPCLAFALQETLRVNVWTAGLDELRLSVGPWLNAAKRAVRSGASDDMEIEAGPGRRVRLGRVRDKALQVAPGQRIAYVTDARFTPANVASILDLARNADHLFIEAAFLEEDEGVAAQRLHLTAQQAGELARRAGARRFTVFHHSPRYLDRREALLEEADRAFRGEPPAAV